MPIGSNITRAKDSKFCFSNLRDQNRGQTCKNSKNNEINDDFYQILHVCLQTRRIFSFFSQKFWKILKKEKKKRKRHEKTQTCALKLAF